jgi:hypothetical protein
MRAVVRKQATLLAVGMLAGILSAALGSLAQGVLHVSGLWVTMTGFGTAMLLLVKIRPDLLR